MKTATFEYLADHFVKLADEHMARLTGFTVAYRKLPFDNSTLELLDCSTFYVAAHTVEVIERGRGYTAIVKGIVGTEHGTFNFTLQRDEGKGTDTITTIESPKVQGHELVVLAWEYFRDDVFPLSKTIRSL